MMIPDILASVLFAQDAPAPAPTGPSGFTVLFLQFGAIFALAYFLFIRPQQRQRKAHEQRIRQVKRGDEIVSSGGIIGEIVHIKEGTKDGAPAPTMADRITIKSGESRLVISRSSIARVVEGASDTVAEKEK